MKTFGEIRHRRGEAVRVTVEQFKGHHRADVREYFEIAPGGVLRPSRRGINIPLALLPRLRHAIVAAERDAFERGLLEAEDYQLEDGRTIPPLGSR